MFHLITECTEAVFYPSKTIDNKPLAEIVMVPAYQKEKESFIVEGTNGYMNCAVLWNSVNSPATYVLDNASKSCTHPQKTTSQRKIHP